MADNDSVWMYSPSLALAVLATVLYGTIFLVLFYLTVIKYRAWFFTCVVVGAAIEVVGYAMRSWSAKEQTKLVPFIITLTFIVLAPVFVAAGNYLLIGRLIRAVLPPDRHKVFGLHARFLTRFFVSCDIISFFIQSAGSGVASTDNWTGPNKDIGTYILIGGLSFQVLAFSAYMCIFTRFHFLANAMEMDTAPRGWRNVVKAVYVSSLLIMLRSIYRVAEFAEGIDGYAFTHEWIFWVFEASPMLFAIGIFCVWHPSRFLGRGGAKSQKIRRKKNPWNASMLDQEVALDHVNRK